MNAHDLLTLAHGYGVEVSTNGEKLKVQFDESRPPPDKLIDLLRNHKADLLAYLASQSKHPTHHTGAYVALTANQSRALAAVGMLLQRAQQRLTRQDKPISDAEVSVTEWHTKVMQRLELSRDQMRDLERSLVVLGMIKIDSHRNYVSLSDCQPLTQQQQTESEPLAWDGYRSFSQWLYS
jgi:oligoendopeptidase F